MEPERPRPLAKKPKARQCLSLDALNLNWPKRKRNRHERPGHAISWRSLCSVQRSSFQFSSVQFDSNRYQCDFQSSSVSVWVSPRVSVCNFAVSILNWARPPHCIYAWQCFDSNLLNKLRLNVYNWLTIVWLSLAQRSGEVPFIWWVIWRHYKGK